MKELRLEYQKETGVQIGNTIDQDAIAEIHWDGPNNFDTDDDADIIDDGPEPKLDIDSWLEVKEYIEWLEEKLLDDTALFNLVNTIFYEKDKAAGKHIHDPDQ